MADVGNLSASTFNVSLNFTWESEWNDVKDGIDFTVTNMQMSHDYSDRNLLVLNGLADMTSSIEAFFDVTAFMIQNRLESLSNAGVLNDFGSRLLTNLFALVPT